MVAWCLPIEDIGTLKGWPNPIIPYLLPWVTANIIVMKYPGFQRIRECDDRRKTKGDRITSGLLVSCVRGSIIGSERFKWKKGDLISRVSNEKTLCFLYHKWFVSCNYCTGKVLRYNTSDLTDIFLGHSEAYGHYSSTLMSTFGQIGIENVHLNTKWVHQLLCVHFPWLASGIWPFRHTWEFSTKSNFPWSWKENGLEKRNGAY